MKAISQSSMSRYYDPTVCEIAWVHEFVKGKRTPPSEVMQKGLVFEWELIGGCRGGVRPELPKSRAKGKLFGTPLKDERDLLELAAQNQMLIDLLGYKLIEVQPEWKHEDLEAHLDAVAMIEGRKCIVDVKYTETAENDFRNGWADLDSKSNIQPVHYVYMSKLIYGEYLPFYYWIFGKSGWVRLIKVEINPTAIEEHEYNLERFREHLKDFKPQPSRSYNKCRTCPHWDYCDYKTTLPTVELHEVSTVIMNS